MESNRLYFREREAQESAAAKRAANAKARAAHEEMAARYRQLNDSLEPGEDKAASGRPRRSSTATAA